HRGPSQPSYLTSSLAFRPGIPPARLMPRSGGFLLHRPEPPMVVLPGLHRRLTSPPVRRRGCPMSGSHVHVLDLAESVDLSHRESGTHLSEDRDDALQEVILIRIRSSNADTGAQPQGGTLLPVADEHRIVREHRRDDGRLAPHVRGSGILRTTLREVVAVSALGKDELLVHVGVQTESGRLVLQAEAHGSDAPVKRVSEDRKSVV